MNNFLIDIQKIINTPESHVHLEYDYYMDEWQVWEEIEPDFWEVMDTLPNEEFE